MYYILAFPISDHMIHLKPSSGHDYMPLIQISWNKGWILSTCFLEDNSLIFQKAHSSKYCVLKNVYAVIWYGFIDVNYWARLGVEITKNLQRRAEETLFFFCL